MLMFFTLLTACASSSYIYAVSVPTEEVCRGIGATSAGTGCATNSGGSIVSIVSKVLNIFSWVVGVVALFFAIFAGFTYITSGGETGKVKNAKDTLLYVVVGLIVVALSQLVVNFVLKSSNEAVSFYIVNSVVA